jgi:hypothetical protein
MLGTHGNEFYCTICRILSPSRPMSHISAIYGTDDDTDIMQSLYTIANVRTMCSPRI